MFAGGLNVKKMDRRVSIFKQNKHAGKLNIVMTFLVIVYRWLMFKKYWQCSSFVSFKDTIFKYLCVFSYFFIFASRHMVLGMDVSLFLLKTIGSLPKLS